MVWLPVMKPSGLASYLYIRTQGCDKLHPIKAKPREAIHGKRSTADEKGKGTSKPRGGQSIPPLPCGLGVVSMLPSCVSPAPKPPEPAGTRWLMW